MINPANFANQQANLKVVIIAMMTAKVHDGSPQECWLQCLSSATTSPASDAPLDPNLEL